MFASFILEMIEEDNIDKIRTKFNELDSVDDFVGLINFANQCLIGSDSVTKITKSQITYYAFHAKNRYSTFDISKKDGGIRTITSPVKQLKQIQSCINLILQLQFKSHHASHGFLHNRNIVSNARKHIYKKFVINVDIENFFPSVEFRRIKAVLELAPFSLTKSREPISFLIANLCAEGGVLPQGAPTSPILTNIVCQRLDRKLFALSKELKCAYSRYADDITFSSNKDLDSNIILQIGNVVEKEGFKLKSSKSRIQSYKERQEVTGLIVNRKVNVNRKYIRNIRAVLFNYEKYGRDYAQKRFDSFWVKNEIKPPPFEVSLLGKIHFAGMVRGKNDPLYKKLLDRYNFLFNSDHLNYSFIEVRAVREQLERDNKRMEEVKQGEFHSEEEQFVQYCLFAFYQIEELINYYFTKKYSLEELIDQLVLHTTSKRKTLKGKHHLGEFNVVLTLFLFEKELFYKSGVFYKSVLTILRIIRNWALHRNNSHPRNDEIVVQRYDEIQEKKKNYLNQNQEFLVLTWRERKYENEGEALFLIRSRNYGQVRTAVDQALVSVKKAINT